MLRAAGVVPVLVFDGCRLPAKAATNGQRRQRRREGREKALALVAQVREPRAGQQSRSEWWCLTAVA